MSSAHSKYLDIYMAHQFMMSVSGSSASNVYLTFGKSLPWSSDGSPDPANTSIRSDIDIWKNMMGGKKITGNNLKHGIKRFNWTTDTAYVAYDDMMDTHDYMTPNSAFYVMTDEYNIYKCLANNNGANSTVKPTTTSSLGNQTTLDGYTWKYMYTLSKEDRLRFLTDSFIPVKTLGMSDGSSQWTVQNDARPGAIDIIKITNAGSNYTANDIAITITGDGRDANAFALINTTSNTVSSIVVDNRGTGYTYANVTLTSSLGSGAIARAVMSPPGGHGSDALNELGGNYIIMNVQLRNSEGGVLTIQNDYRQIAVVDSPLVYGTANVMSNTVVDQLMSITLNGSSIEYVEDEIVYQGATLDTYTFKGVVTEWDSPNNIIKLSRTEGTPGSQLLTGATSTASRYVSLVEYPDMEPYSGKILYMDNIVPIERAYDQTEDFKIVLNF